MIDPATLSEVEALKRRTHALRRVEYVPASRVVTVRRNGRMIVRVMGAGGAGQGGDAHARVGGNAGTVGFRNVRVTKGEQYVITIPAAASGRSGAGDNGGTLTINGPGVSISVPGGRGGGQAGVGENAPPTGLELYWLGGPSRGGRGAEPKRFWGVERESITGAGVPAEERLEPEACVLLMPKLTVVGRGFGVGGKAGNYSDGYQGGDGGRGAGGGASGSSGSYSSYSGGDGGLAWVTLEFLEDEHV